MYPYIYISNLGDFGGLGNIDLVGFVPTRSSAILPGSFLPPDYLPRKNHLISPSFHSYVNCWVGKDVAFGVIID